MCCNINVLVFIYNICTCLFYAFVNGPHGNQLVVVCEQRFNIKLYVMLCYKKNNSSVSHTLVIFVFLFQTDSQEPHIHTTSKPSL